jgi:hypothetical protein
MIPRVFISYRRDDRPVVAAQIYQALAQAYRPGNVHFDVTMQVGQKYNEVLAGWLGVSDVVLALVGPHWDGRQNDDDRPRILAESDWIHQEMKYAHDARKKVIVVSVREPMDTKYYDIPKYSEDQLRAWGATAEERKGIQEREELRLSTHSNVSLSHTGGLDGIDDLKSNIARLHQGTGRWWVPAWKLAGGLAVFALAVLAAVVGGWVAANTAAISPLEASMKKTTDDLADRAKKVTGDLADLAAKTEKAIRNRDGVYINAVTVKDFIDVWKSNDDFTQYKNQYVNWKLTIKYRPDTSVNSRYRFTLIPTQQDANGSEFTVEAYFDEWEYNELNRRWPEDKVGRGPFYVSGRIDEVNSKGVVLQECRVILRK